MLSKTQKGFRQWYPLIFGAMIILIPVLYFVVKYPKKVEAVWYNDGWHYRTEITFGNTGAEVTKQKVKFDIDTAALITAGKMQADCGDSRFTDVTGKELLYYMDSSGGACNTSSTDYYVLFDKIVTGTNQVYHYYGNTSALNGTVLANFSESTFSPTSGPTGGTEEKGNAPGLFLKFDEGTDNTCKDGTEDTCDSSSNQNDGDRSGATWQNQDFCVSGKCLYFDGSDDVVTVDNTDSIDFDRGLSTALTFEAWIRVNSDGENDTGEIIDKGSNFYIRIDSEGTDGLADLEASIDLATTDATANITDGITLNKWHHIAVSYTDDSDDDISVYIDGVLKGTGDGSGSPAGTDTSDILIGGDSTNNFNGFIDEVKIYDTERTSTQIVGDFQKVSGNEAASVVTTKAQDYLSTGLTGYWPMDEKTLNTCGTNTDACDKSGNAYNLKATNDATSVNINGRYSNGTEYDGTGDYYCADINDDGTCDSTNALRITGGITISMWINYDSVADIETIIYQGSTGSETEADNELYFLRFDTTSGTDIEYGHENGSGTDNTNIFDTNLSADTWYYLTLVRNTATNEVKLFVNGTQSGSTYTYTTDPSGGSSGVFTIGSDNAGSNSYDGTIDEVRIYNYAVADNSIYNLYNWGPAPTLYWNFDENTGTSTVNDRSGNGKTGTINGSMLATDWIPGKYGTTLSLDGSNDNISRADDSNLDFAASNDFTLTAWFKHGTSISTDEFIITKADTTNGGYKIYMSSTGSITFEIDDDSSWTPDDRAQDGTVVADGYWHHIAAVKTGTSKIELYIDGILTDTDSSLAATGTLENANSFYAGIDRDGSTEPWNGEIDEIKVYNYARSRDQILLDYNATHLGIDSPFGQSLAYWKFDCNVSSSNCGKDYTEDATSKDLNSITSITTDGKLGSAYKGTDNIRGTRNDDNDFDFAGTDQFAISAWFKRSTISNEEYILAKYTSNVGYALYLNSSGQVVFGFSDTGAASFPEESVTSISEYDDGNWHHVLATKQGTNALRLYVDGVEVANDASISNTASLANGSQLFVGDANSTNGTDEFLGDIDEIRFLLYTPNKNQVLSLYNNASAIRLGSQSTSSSGSADNSTTRSYCVPGDASTCTAPTGHWKMDENTGQRIENTTSGGGDELLLGGSTSVQSIDPVYLNGHIGAALDFDGTDDYARTQSDDDALDFADGSDFSISIWIYRDVSTSDDVVLNKGPRNITDGTTDAGYIIWLDGSTDTAHFKVADGAQTYKIDGTTTISAPGWHQIVAVFDDDSTTNTTIYVDGVDDKSAATGTLSDINDIANTTQFWLGVTRSITIPFDGKMDDLIIYPYTRTAQQIAATYKDGAPLAYWKFDECQGNTAYDSSGNGYSGTLNFGASGNTSTGSCGSGTATEMWNDGTTGKINSAVGVDGTDDYIQISDTAKLRFDAATQDFSLLAWVKRTTTGTEYIISKEDADNDGYRLMFNSSNQVLCSEDSTDVTSSNSITDTNWHLIGCTIDRDGNGQVYIDGLADGSTAAMGSDAMATTSNILIGTRSYTSTSYFNGLIDEIKVFNYVLTSTQIKSLYSNGAAKFN